MDKNDLNRFLMAQDIGYPTALRELRAGRKRSHWMWYIFPQLRGLGESSYSHFFGIRDLREARDYLAHPILSERLMTLSEILLQSGETDPVRVFGEIDAKKLQSSMTLFSFVDPENEHFSGVLSRYYHGERDNRTLRMLEKESDVPNI